MANGKNTKDRSKERPKERGRAPERPRAPLSDTEPRRNWRQAVPSLGLWGILLVLGVSVAVLTNPAATGPSLPLSDEDVGKVATSDIRAPISFTVPDIESTERKRREAEEDVPSLYDFYTELGSERVRRLREAFAEMRQIIEEHRQEPGEQDESAGVEKRRRASGTRRKSGAARAADAPEEQSDPDGGDGTSLDGILDAKRDQFLRKLQVVVSEEDFTRLREDRFSESTVGAIAKLVERTMQYMIVRSRELLAAERERGIKVRFIEGRERSRERVVISFNKILDMEEALLRLEQTAALDLSDVPAELRSTQIRLAKGLITPNLEFNEIATRRRKQQARESIQPLEIRIKKGAKIIRDGDLIDKTHVRIFQEMKKLTEMSNAMEVAIGTVLLVMLVLGLITRFSCRNIRAFLTRTKDLVLMGTVLFVFVVTIKLWFWVFAAVYDRFPVFPLESYYYAIPFAAGAMLIRFVLNSEMALVFSAAAAVLAGVLMENHIGYSIYCLGSSLVAAWAVASARQRSSLLKAGAITGLANMALALALSMFYGSFLSFETLFNVIFAFSGGILVAMIVTATAPVIEVLFGYTTDVKLMELANLNHPLLKDLIVQAPGSYHHSIIVGSLVEAAAESIHCNPLLARVMAYYHDIGKVKSPSYFSENQRDSTNPHQKLKPSLSATVLKAHVKDGADLARASKLGEPIVEAIQQHHGTSLIKFFFQKAKDAEDPANPVKEEEFRYQGPKPQSREVALVMLADSVEAAAKSISDPSPARLQGLVQNMINRIFSDGQLNECDLTLRDLHEIARAFNRVLAGIYHHRPDYPEAATKELKAGDKKAKPDSTPPGARKEGPDKAKEAAEAEKKEEDLKRLGM